MFKILVVEDERELNRTVCTFLNNSGYEATGCLSANEAYDAMYDTVFDLIISDIMMPEMDGIETLGRIKADEDNPNNTTTVIMLTANALIGMKEMYIDKGFTDYLSKPIVPDKLEKVIGSYLPEEKMLSASEEANEAEKVRSPLPTSDTAETELKDTDSPLEKIKKLIPDVNMKMAMLYCSGSEEMYIEFLQDFAESGRYERIGEAYGNTDMKLYTIEVHTLKSTSKTLGFDRLSKLAEQLQFAAGKNDIAAVNENHDEMMKLYSDILTALKRVF
mgnify:CR=1 FL=1